MVLVQGKEVVAFERHLSLLKKGGNHCHINVVPIPASAASKCKQVRPPLHAAWLVVAFGSSSDHHVSCDWEQLEGRGIPG